MKFLISPSYIKQIARQLKSQKSITHSRALDDAVRQFGYSNYKNYLNASEANHKYCEDIIVKMSLENNIPKKMDLALSWIKKTEISFQDFFDILKLFERPQDLILRF